jgi:probable rRNA maturation factor
MIRIQISSEQTALKLDRRRLRSAASRIVRDAGLRQAEISLAIVDDRAIHELNRKFLAHDYATDVLSFLLERTDDRLEGEVIASADTAIRSAAKYGWQPGDELLLYVIHGMLHLVGYDDTSPRAKSQMRKAERAYLEQFGLEPRY